MFCHPEFSPKLVGLSVRLGCCAVAAMHLWRNYTGPSLTCTSYARVTM